MDKEIRIRPHNDDKHLFVVELRKYTGDSEQLGEEIISDVCVAEDLMNIVNEYITRI